MHELNELGAWDRLLKKILWKQLENIKGKKILDFGSGQGITANHFAAENEVTAVEPWDEMLKERWADYSYEMINGTIDVVKKMPDNSFDLIICHNVLEYIDDKAEILQELSRVLKQGGTMSIVKHNRAGRVMQMAVLLDDFDKANDLLDGQDSTASKFGKIRYYEDDDICKWVPGLDITKVYGIRTFWDLQQNQDKHGTDEWQDKMQALEMRVSEIPEYRDIAFFHHLILEKR